MTKLLEAPQLPASLGWLARTHDAMGALEEWVGMTLLAIMAIVVNLEIFARYVFGSPFIWTEEVTRLTLVWLTFISVPALIRKGGDMAINTFTEMLPPSPQLWAHVLRDILMLVVYGLVAWEGFRLARAVVGMPLVVTEWPTALLAWPLVIGSVLVMLHVAVRLLRTILAIRQGQPHNPGAAA